MATTQTPFLHEALLYNGDADFVDRVGAFLVQAVDDGVPALAVLSEPKIRMLRQALGTRADAVRFADMAEVGRNPATIIPLWKSFVEAAELRDGVQLCGVGEPFGVPRDGDAAVECHAHEALINEALAGAPLRLVCPYDVDTLDREHVAMAIRNHPVVANGHRTDPNMAFDAFDWLRAPLPSPPAASTRLDFGLSTLPQLRRIVRRQASGFGLARTRCDDLVLAVSEVATNSVMYGGGSGTLWMWTTGDRVLCEIADAGRVRNPMIGRIRPAPAQEGGHGLWLANRLVDLVQLRSDEQGTSVRLALLR